MEKIAQGHGREANIAQGKAELVPAIILVSRPSPSAFFSILHSRQCYTELVYCTGWFIRTNYEGASWGH